MNGSNLSFLIDHWYAISSWAFVATLSVFYLVLRVQTRQSRRYILRLKFYQIRDALRLAVAQGTLKEDGTLFRHYDKLINALVRDTERWTLFNVGRAIAKYGKELSPGDKRHQEEIKRLVNSADPRVQKLVCELYIEVAKLIVKQSKFIFILGTILLGLSKFYKQLVPTSFSQIHGKILRELINGPRFKIEAERMASDIRAAHC